MEPAGEGGGGKVVIAMTAQCADCLQRPLSRCVRMVISTLTRANTAGYHFYATFF